MAHVLTLSCPDQPGLVAAVTGLLATHGGNILQSQQFDDLASRRFFMRLVFDLPAAAEPAFRAAFAPLAAERSMDWRLRDMAVPMRVAVLVSRFDHCLADLVYRARIGDLALDLAAIVSNHPQDALAAVPIGAIPFHLVPITAATRVEAEARLRAIIEDSGAELVVLARYMQILSDDLAGWLHGRCINIHHSFLPGFKGARPYHQAHARGVKMIGATAHYVTGDLDEGPIIAQDVEPISHSHSPDDLVRKGRDIERRVLARAVGWHLEDRVLLNGQRTVVFQD
jgi:formyltetrahydrofolate deformylase